MRNQFCEVETREAADNSLLTPSNCGSSQLACRIINETFLSLDGFEQLRKHCNESTYDSLAFAASLARIVDRELAKR